MTPKKPGQVLGFVLYGSIGVGVIWFILHFMSTNPWVERFTLEGGNRVSFGVGYLAYLAALWGARTAVVNMVRQHTVNTLLQSRLAPIFIECGQRVVAGVQGWEANGKQGYPHEGYFELKDLDYLLNFYEYIAVGVKHGDLDEDFMYDTLRSVVINLCGTFNVYIKSEQQKNPRFFCNLTDLRDKWIARRDKEELDKEVSGAGWLATRCAASYGAIVAVSILLLLSIFDEPAVWEGRSSCFLIDIPESQVVLYPLALVFSLPFFCRRLFFLVLKMQKNGFNQSAK